eukprot:XP_001700700.1 predicted protein [Chlamydomonas reinhardtii]
MTVFSKFGCLGNPTQMLHELGRAVERARHWKSTFKRQFFLAAVSLGKCEPGSQLNPPVPVTLMELTGSKSKPERACDYVREGGALLVQEIMAGQEGWLQADLSGKARMLLEIAALEGAPTPGTLAANNPTYNYAVRAFEDAAQRMAGEVSNSGASGDTCGRTVAVSGIDGSSSGHAGASSGAASGSLPAPPARAAQRSSARLAAPRGQRNVTGPHSYGFVVRVKACPLDI